MDLARFCRVQLGNNGEVNEAPEIIEQEETTFNLVDAREYIVAAKEMISKCNETERGRREFKAIWQIGKMNAKELLKEKSTMDVVEIWIGVRS